MIIMTEVVIEIKRRWLEGRNGKMELENGLQNWRRMDWGWIGIEWTERME